MPQQYPAMTLPPASPSCGRSHLQELQAALDALRQIFAEAGLEHLLSDPDALKALGARSFHHCGDGLSSFIGAFLKWAL